MNERQKEPERGEVMSDRRDDLIAMLFALGIGVAIVAPLVIGQLVVLALNERCAAGGRCPEAGIVGGIWLLLLILVPVAVMAIRDVFGGLKRKEDSS